MPNTDAYETELLHAYEKGVLKSVATKSELARFKAAARATAIKDRRVNIRLSSGDLQDIQVKALAEGLPYQTLIASVLHKYATGKLTERADAASEAPPCRQAACPAHIQGWQLTVQSLLGGCPSPGYSASSGLSTPRLPLFTTCV